MHFVVIFQESGGAQSVPLSRFRLAFLNKHGCQDTLSLKPKLKCLQEEESNLFKVVHSHVKLIEA